MGTAFRKRVLGSFKSVKREKFSFNLPAQVPVYNDEGKLVAWLRPLTESTLCKAGEIKLLTKWRADNYFAFPSQFKVTGPGTRKWLKNQLLNNPSRILFFIESSERKPKLIGHLGLYSFDFKQESCEVDNVIRGVKEGYGGYMTFALKTLTNWAEHVLRPRKIYLRVFSDNGRAISYYEKCGFIKYKLIPLEKHEAPELLLWKEKPGLKKAERYFLKMLYTGCK